MPGAHSPVARALSPSCLPNGEFDPRHQCGPGDRPGVVQEMRRDPGDRARDTGGGLRLTASQFSGQVPPGTSEDARRGTGRNVGRRSDRGAGPARPCRGSRRRRRRAIQHRHHPPLGHRRAHTSSDIRTRSRGRGAGPREFPSPDAVLQPHRSGLPTSGADQFPPVTPRVWAGRVGPRRRSAVRAPNDLEPVPGQRTSILRTDAVPPAVPRHLVSLGPCPAVRAVTERRPVSVTARLRQVRPRAQSQPALTRGSNG